MRTVRTQQVAPTIQPGITRREKAAAKYPGMHLVLVEDEPVSNPYGYQSPLEDYLDAGFVQLEGGREATGKDRLRLIGMPKDQWNEMQKQHLEEAQAATKPRKGMNKDGTWQEVKRGGPLSFGDLAKIDAEASTKEPLSGFMSGPEN